MNFKKTNIKIIFAFFIFLSMFIPITINEMYKLNSGYTTVWGGDTVLLFYGSVLSFAGTICLGGVAFWQNEKLHRINKNLTEHQYKPIITTTIIPEENVNAPEESHRTFYRTIKQDKNSTMLNDGYSSTPSYAPYVALKLSNLGLGPAVNVSTLIRKLKTVDGLGDLNEISTINIENFYDKIHLENYEFIKNGATHTNDWIIYTDFNLGISNDNNKLNLVFSFEDITAPIHSIIEFQYENVLGNKYNQYLYLGYNKKASILPISKIY